MATSHQANIHQRHTPSPPNSYLPPSSKTTSESKLPKRSCSPFPSLTTRWSMQRNNAHMLQQCGMRLAELCLTAIAMLVIPFTIQYCVHSIDEIYEVLGRRARSQFVGIGWGHLVFGGLLLGVWHVWLGRLSYGAIIEDGESEGEEGQQRNRTGTTWGRVLGRIVIPGYLFVSAAILLFNLMSRLQTPTFITTNTNSNLEAGHAD